MIASKEESAMPDFGECFMSALADYKKGGHDVVIDHKQVCRFESLRQERFIKSSLRRYGSEGYENIRITKTALKRARELLKEAVSSGIDEDTVLRRYMLLGLLLNSSLKVHPFYKDIVDASTQEEKREVLEALLWRVAKQRSLNEQP